MVELLRATTQTVLPIWPPDNGHPKIKKAYIIESFFNVAEIFDI